VKDIQTQQKTNLGLAVVCTLTSICHSGLAQAAVQVGGTALMARHSRLEELQADSEAVVNLARAGYDPRGVPELFEILLQERQSEPSVVEGWFASHPLEETRIQRARDLIARLRVDPNEQLIVDSRAFQAFKARIAQLPAPPPPPRGQSGQP
jgi:predicted Zn-dependent protease